MHTSTGAVLNDYVIGWLSNCGPVVPPPHGPLLFFPEKIPWCKRAITTLAITQQSAICLQQMNYVRTSIGAALKGYIIGWLSNCGTVVRLPHLRLRSFVILPHHLLYWASSKGKEETVSSKVKAMRDNM